jgi:xanthine dehydrogenase accessory factor
MSSAAEWRTMAKAAESFRDSGGEFLVLATVMRTHGPTFRRRGARTLILPSGEALCELAGGCPERDIALRAVESLGNGQSSLVHYNAQSNLDLLMEVGCGGELDVLIEPLAISRATGFFGAVSRCMNERRRAWLATVFDEQRGNIFPRRMVVLGDQVIFNDPLGADWRKGIVDAVANAQGRSAFEVCISDSRHGAWALVEPIRPDYRLLIIGDNPTALALARACDLLGWECLQVIHATEADAPRARAGNAQRIHASPKDLPAIVPLDPFTAAVVLTHNIERDMAYLRALGNEPLGYLGALGSRDRAARMRGELSGFASELYAPAGLDLGSDSPTEIALAVTSEILAVLNARSGGHLHRSLGDIHTKGTPLPQVRALCVQATSADKSESGGAMATAPVDID